MKKFTTKAAAFLIFAIIGALVAIYSITIKNYILLSAAVLFAAVSTDNIFCNLRTIKIIYKIIQNKKWTA